MRYMLTALALVLAVLYGCERAGDSRVSGQDTPWPQTAVVAEVSLLSSAGAVETPLADLKAIGFDTVLFDARGVSRALLDRWLEAAKSLPLRTVAWVDPPEGAGAAPSGEGRVSPDEPAPLADGLMLTLEDPGAVASARDLRQRLQESGAATLLIARVATQGSPGGTEPERGLPEGLFDAVLLEDASGDILSLLRGDDPMPPSVFAEGYRLGAGDKVLPGALSRWQRIPHCRASGDRRCSEDLRLLVMGVIQSPVPVIGFIQEPFWRDVYGSLIRLRRDTPLILDGEVEWYAVDDEAGVLAYRITNDRGHHVLVAVNVSTGHHELPLPFGFMAVSKVKLWASYDPTIRELVTSRPVALPAGSVVVVVEN